MKKLLLFTLLVMFVGTLFAQDTLKIGKEPKQVKIIPLPILGANPTLGWMFGVAPSATWYMGDEKTTSLSSALGSVFYTTKNQLISTAKASTYFEGDRWNMLTDIRYFITSQPTYGLGTGPHQQSLLGVDL